MILLNGKEVAFVPGQTILELAQAHGIDVPTLCHDERIEPYGACGLCVCEVKMGQASAKLMRACATKIADGMVIETHSERASRSRRFVLDMLLSDHTGDCVAPCSLACPGGTDCQKYAALIARGEYHKAAKTMKDVIPIPASIGRICPHPCEKKCRRALVEEPVSLAALKAFGADMDLQDMPFVPDCAPNTGKRVAVIGGGPGGLTAAYHLRRKGHEVHIYDKMPKLGGMLRYGIPEYRLPKAVLDKEIALIADIGVQMHTNTMLGKDVTLDELRKEYDAVVAATGAWVSSRMRVAGEDLAGVFGGIDFLRETALGDPPAIGKTVAVCGGGNTAMDACRTAVRLGAETVYVIYRRTRDEMPAEQIEIEEAIEEGVQFKFLTNPDEICGDGKVQSIRLQCMELGEPDASGRRKPVPIEGKFETLAVDSVIMAIGQKTDFTGLEALETTGRGTVLADAATFKTNLDGVFAVGDVSNKGADIAIAAVGEARKAADVIDAYLNGIEIAYEKPFVCEKEVTAADLADRAKQGRAVMPVLTPEERRHTFREMALGFDEETARREASRCLECGCLDYAQCRLIRFAREYKADPAPYAGEKNTRKKDDSHAVILRDGNKCILCGLCVRACDQLEKLSAIGLAGRGFTTEVGAAFRVPLGLSNCNGCGKCVDVCPTGALYQKSEGKKNVAVDRG
ncbi:MAG: FAD-dependent oxidoreductase [Clostridia bacterium]|nr:FAD-dependent oxidoreductase [Clostridia bacterium]